MKKLISILFALVLGVSGLTFLTGCAGGDAANKAENTIDVLLLTNSQETTFYTQHFKSVAEEKEITVNFKGVAWNQYYERLNAEIAGGTMPDIIYARASDMRAFISEELIIPIQDYVSDQSTVDLTKLYDNALNIYRYNESTHRLGSGDLYAVPKDLSVQQLGYNKKLVREKSQQIKNAGLKLPWEMDFSKENYTWAQYKQLAQICRDLSDSSNPVYGCDLPDIEILTWSFGGQLLSDDLQNVTVNTAAVKQAVAYQAELLSDNTAIYKDDKEFEDFIAGKLAFYGKVNSYDIANFDEYFGEDWDVMPWPVAEGKSAESWTGKITSAGYAVSSMCENPELAVEVALTLLTEKTQDKIVAEEKLALPMYKDVAENSYYLSEYDSVYSPKNRKVYIDVISGRNGKYSANYSTYNALWRDAFDTDYLEKLYVLPAKDVLKNLKTDAEYAALESKMQSIYNEDINS